MKIKIQITTSIIGFLATAMIFFNSCKKDTDGSGTIKDQEGNNYGVVRIGDQVRMTENLRVASYRDGTGILSRLYADFEWASAGPACAVYHDNLIDGLNSEAEVAAAYGLLYNWEVVNSNRGLCPTGWHVPTDEDWDELAAYLGGEDLAGGKLKSKRTEPVSHPQWDSPNTGATDSYYFSALPGGFRSYQGWYDGAGYSTTWWSSTEYDANFSVTRSIYNGEESLERAYRRKRSGSSVRCIQD